MLLLFLFFVFAFKIWKLLCCYYHVMFSCGSVSLVKIYCWMYFCSFFVCSKTRLVFSFIRNLYLHSSCMGRGQMMIMRNAQISEYCSFRKIINHENVEFIKFPNIESLPLLGIFCYYFGLTFLHTFL